MRAGRVHFDGPAHELTNALVREIYGAAGLNAEIDESVTSTAIGTDSKEPTDDRELQSA